MTATNTVTVEEQALRSRLGEILAQLRDAAPDTIVVADPRAKEVFQALDAAGYSPGKVTVGPRALAIRCTTVQAAIALVELFLHSGARSVTLHRPTTGEAQKTGHRAVAFVSFGRPRREETPR